MGKLNIAHHKSYHPYRRDNIERVRKDEEEAHIKEAKEEGRITLADSEARIALLRQKAGGSVSSKSRKREDEKRERELLAQATDTTARREALAAGPSTSSLGGTGKHINLFEDLEKNSTVANTVKAKAFEKVGKGKEIEESEKGIPLAPSQKDLRPWYSERAKDPAEGDEKDRVRDLRVKSQSDPLTGIQNELASRYPSSSSSSDPSSRARTWGAPALPNPGLRSNTSHHRKSSSQASPPRHSQSLPVPASGKIHVDPEAVSESRVTEVPGPDRDSQSHRNARVSRESIERARARELKARKKREEKLRNASATPSTVRGMDEGYRYGDQFNARDVEEAHRSRVFERPRHKRNEALNVGWDDDGPSFEREGSRRVRRDRDRRKGS